MIKKSSFFFTLLFLLLFYCLTVKSQEAAIDFAYPDVNGDTVILSSFAGKVVYVEVWASWCQYCRKEISDLKKLQRLFKNDDVVFINVSIEENDVRWRIFINEKKIGGINLITKEIFNSAIVKEYEIKAIPHYILVDRKGNIVSKNASRPSSFTIVDEISTLLENK